MKPLHEPNERADSKWARTLSHRLQSGSKTTRGNPAHPLNFILEGAQRKRGEKET